MSEIDTKFELCRDVEYVLKIGRDYQNKDGFRGAHYDTLKLLCDTIEYLRDQLPKPDPDWKEICEKCHDGEIEPKECEYYGEPDGCNSPIYGEHPKAKHGNAAAMRDALETGLTIIRGIINGTIARTNNSVFDCRDKLKAALSKPPRNCDVGTAEEQAEGFHNFCVSNSSSIDGMCDPKCPFIENTDKCHCLCEWAKMPYEAEDADDFHAGASL